jgi:tol-pal system protein YbgF
MRISHPLAGALALALSIAAAGWSSPAAAQKLSLADRVSRLEQQSANAGASAGQANVELLNRMAQMQGEIQALRNQLEQLQNENAQLKQQARDQYVDLDSRLQRVEAGATAAPPATSTPSRPPASTPAAPVSRPAAGGALPAPAGDRAAEQASYDAALSSLRRGDYVASSRGFQDYLSQFPGGALAPNAWYWLGESYYATQNYPLAQRAFETLLSQFPDSPKAPDALLKRGYSQIEQGERGPGQQTLNRVINDYPGSDAARLAASRLRALSLDAR